MNKAHLQNLSSPERARWLRAELLPWLEKAGTLGDDVLEIGPGPGLTTDLLRQRVPHLTALESDPTLAKGLMERLAGTNVEVIEGDATASKLRSGGFSAVCCFSMFHHVPSTEQQNAVLLEIARLLRHGGYLFGEDGIDSPFARLYHVGDVFVPLDPVTLPERLTAAGLTSVSVEARSYRVKFVAVKV